MSCSSDGLFAECLLPGAQEAGHSQHLRQQRAISHVHSFAFLLTTSPASVAGSFCSQQAAVAPLALGRVAEVPVTESD